MLRLMMATALALAAAVVPAIADDMGRASAGNGLVFQGDASRHLLQSGERVVISGGNGGGIVITGDDDNDTCGGENAECCPGNACNSSGLTCRTLFNRCFPCGGRLQPICTAPGTPQCSGDFRVFNGRCFTNTNGSPPAPTNPGPGPGQYGGPTPAPVAPAPTVPPPTVTPRGPPAQSTCSCSGTSCTCTVDCGDIGEGCCATTFPGFTVSVCTSGACVGGTCTAVAGGGCGASTAVGGNCVLLS